MKPRVRQSLLGGALASTMLLGAYPAAAQTNDQLQQQIQQLQRQLQDLQNQVNKQAAQPPAAQPAPAPGTGILSGVKATMPRGNPDVPFTTDEPQSSNYIMFTERAEIQTPASLPTANDARAALGVRSTNDRYWAGVYLTGRTAGALHIGSNQQQLGGTARAT